MSGASVGWETPTNVMIEGSRRHLRPSNTLYSTENVLTASGAEMNDYEAVQYSNPLFQQTLFGL